MSFRETFEKLLGKTWNPSKLGNLRELWRSCTVAGSQPALSQSNIPKLKQIASLLKQYCEAKAVAPSEMQPAIKEVEKVGIPDTPDFEFGTPKYLGFVQNPASSSFGGTFYFKIPVTKIFRMGMDYNESGERVYKHRRKNGYGYLKIQPDGKMIPPYPRFKSEDDIDENWKEFKKNNKVISGSISKIKSKIA